MRKDFKFSFEGFIFLKFPHMNYSLKNQIPILITLFYKDFYYKVWYVNLEKRSDPKYCPLCWMVLFLRITHICIVIIQNLYRILKCNYIDFIISTLTLTSFFLLCFILRLILILSYVMQIWRVLYNVRWWPHAVWINWTK